MSWKSLSGNFEKVSNRQQVPDEIAMICERINNDRNGNEIRIAADEYASSYIRVYDPALNMAYGRRGAGAEPVWLHRRRYAGLCRCRCHRLPVRRGLIVTDDVIESKNSLVIPEAIPRVRFDEAKQRVAEKYNRQFRNPFDLEPEEEVLIGQYFKDPRRRLLS